MSMKQPTSAEALARLLGTSSGQTARILSTLAKQGVVERLGAGWIRSAGLVPVGRTYALEAKVEDWRSGLNQSLRYGVYADSTSVVLPKLSDKVKLAALERFRTVGVGLFVDDRWLVRPRLSRLRASRRLLASEYILSALGDTVSVSRTG
jgi:hypothetical protein